jgi:hypothetical protein
MPLGLLIGIAALGLVGAACTPQPVPTLEANGPTPTPVVADTGPTATPTAAEPLTATSKGATLTVTPRSATVPAGGEWTVDVELRNDRDVPLVYGDGPCHAFAGLSVSVPIPLEPVGADWSGMAADFKGYALTNGLAGGGAPAAGPQTQSVFDPSCPEASGDFAELAPGGRVSHSITWTADLLPDLDALAGPVEFTVQAGIDPDRTEPPPPDPAGGPIGSWFPLYTSLDVAGVLTVDQGGQDPISMGQAIDTVLASDRFTSWLAAQAPGTCTGVNVLLMSGQAGSFIPVGPNWEIEVFCEQNVPRHFVLAQVDPLTGALKGLNFCDVPCDR